jgi:chlorite dismutase
VTDPLTRYTVFSVHGRTGGSIEAGGGDELCAWERDLARDDVVLRGSYDVSGLRAGTDLMLWLHGPTAASLQAALRGFRRTAIGGATSQVWSAMGTHRAAEFSADHIPSFLQGTQPLAWLCVYPFVRSYDGYLLPSAERQEMLAEHGTAGRAFTGVQANTVSAFALGDWEWLLALESDDLHELVDLMRDLRATRARRHVRAEIPFHTGRRIALEEVAEVLR